MVASFPTKYTEDLFSSPEDAQCAVCLSEYNLEDVLRILPNCGHSFHSSCVDLWFQQHTACPVWRISLRDISDKSLVVSAQPFNLVMSRILGVSSLIPIPRETNAKQQPQKAFRAWIATPFPQKVRDASTSPRVQ